MAVANLTNEPQEIITGNDNIVIVNVIETIRGGRTLDVTGFAPDVIHAGHVVIRETATGAYKPMPLNTAGTAYDVLPTGNTFAGILIASILKKRPLAAILTRGTVNHLASQFPMTTILTAVKAALPLIDFRED